MDIDIKKLESNIDLTSYDKIIKENLEEQANKNIKIIEQKVIIAARDFLKTFQKAQEKLYEAELIANKLQRIRDIYKEKIGMDSKKKLSNEDIENIKIISNYGDYSALTKYMNDIFNEEIMSEVYAKLEFFNNAVVEFLTGRPLKTIVVIEDKDNNPILYEVNMEEFIRNNLKRTYSSGNTIRMIGKFSISSTSVASTIGSLTQIKVAENITLENTYKDIQQRQRIAKKNDTSRLMQKIKNQQYAAKLTGEGDIIEAYIFFLMKGIQFNLSKEENVRDYVQKGIIDQVDSVAGIFQGDISENELLEQFQGFDYAIKMGKNASYLKLSENISYAENILKLFKNKSDIKSFLMAEVEKQQKEKKKSARTQITKVAAKEVPKELQKYIKNLTT